MNMNTAEPPPVQNDHPAVWPDVIHRAKLHFVTGLTKSALIRDMEERHAMGIAKYGVALQPFNGRNALVDAYQEALDLCVYLRQAVIEAGDDKLKRERFNFLFYEALKLAYGLCGAIPRESYAGQPDSV